MNKKMIEILMSCGFKLNNREQWIIELESPDFDDEIVKYVAREVTDYHNMGQRILVFEIYYDEFWNQWTDDGEGIDFTQFVMFNL